MKSMLLLIVVACAAFAADEITEDFLRDVSDNIERLTYLGPAAECNHQMLLTTFKIMARDGYFEPIDWDRVEAARYEAEALDVTMDAMIIFYNCAAFLWVHENGAMPDGLATFIERERDSWAVTWMYY